MSLTLSKHECTVWSPGYASYFTPTDVSMTVDESFSPHIRASLTVPSAMFTEALDPRTGGRLTVRLHQAFGDLLEFNDLTSFGGGTVSAWTAKYTPVTLRSITLEYTRPWNLFEPGLPLSTITTAYLGDLSQWTTAGFGSMSTLSEFLHGTGAFNPQPSTYIEANLGIRSIKRDLVAGTTKVDLASDEALLQDSARTSSTPYVPATTDVRTLVAYVLGTIGATLQAGTATGTFTEAEWTPGQSAWDFIAPITQKAGLYLYADEARKWWLVPNSSTSGTLELKDDSNVTTLTTTLERKNNYFDSCVVEYVWTNTLGETERAWDVYAPSGSTRTQLVKLTDTPYPGAGMAEQLTNRAKTRGETFDVEAISNYFARPKQVITVDVTGEPLKTAIVQSIDWRQPADRMTVRIRDLEEVI